MHRLLQGCPSNLKGISLDFDIEEEEDLVAPVHDLTEMRTFVELERLVSKGYDFNPTAMFQVVAAGSNLKEFVARKGGEHILAP